MWTRFITNGKLAEKYLYIYIEASEEEAKSVFYNRFGSSPGRLTSHLETCCDYLTFEWGDDLEQITNFGLYPLREDGETLSEFMGQDDILFIFAEDITPEERTARIPLGGWVNLDQISDDELLYFMGCRKERI